MGTNPEYQKTDKNKPTNVNPVHILQLTVDSEYIQAMKKLLHGWIHDLIDII